jgi:hypothetical protein
MAKLVDYVNIVENNEDCVILEVVGTPLDLIRLGCFNGNEKLIRLTKGKRYTCTVWDKDGKSFSWFWGYGGHTLVSDQITKQGKLIQECIEEDFEIYIGENKTNIRNTLHIKSLADVKHSTHNIKLMYFRTDDVCCHIDGEYFKHFKSVDDGIRHFQNKGYIVHYKKDETAVTGCKVKHYYIER